VSRFIRALCIILAEEAPEPAERARKGGSHGGSGFQAEEHAVGSYQHLLLGSNLSNGFDERDPTVFVTITVEADFPGRVGFAYQAPDPMAIGNQQVAILLTDVQIESREGAQVPQVMVETAESIASHYAFLSS